MYIAFGEDGKAKALDEEHTVTIWCESEEGVKNAMATLQSIRAWVPVSRMLPAENAVTDESEEVLVTVQPEDSDECVTEIGYRYHGHWVLRNGLEGEVKAWMRFPKPYKGEMGNKKTG